MSFFKKEVVQLSLDFVKQLCLKIQSERPGKELKTISVFDKVLLHSFIA